jgi:hypothetical protein
MIVHPQPAAQPHLDHLRQGVLTLLTAGALYAIWLGVGLPGFPLTTIHPPPSHQQTSYVAALQAPPLAPLTVRRSAPYAVKSAARHKAASPAVVDRQHASQRPGAARRTDTQAPRGPISATVDTPKPQPVAAQATRRAEPSGASNPPPPSEPPPNDDAPSPSPTGPGDVVSSVVNTANGVAADATQAVDAARNTVEQTVAPVVSQVSNLAPPPPLPVPLPKTGSLLP